MPADLAFLLSYLLGEELGIDVKVVRVEARGGGVVCVEAQLEERHVEACTVVAACRGLEGARLERCISKTLAQGGKQLRELAGRLREATQGSVG